MTKHDFATYYSNRLLNYRLNPLEIGIGHGGRNLIYATRLDPPSRFPWPRSRIFLLKSVQFLVLTASLKYGYKISKNWRSPFSFKPRRVLDSSVSTGIITISPSRKGILLRVWAIPFCASALQASKISIKP